MSSIQDLHPTYQSALSACGQGYNNDIIAAVVAYKTALSADKDQATPEQAINSILAVSLAASDIKHRPLRVLDFGGGCGFHFLRTQPVLAIDLEWAIVETISMVNHTAGVSLGRYTAHDNIQEAIEHLGSVDLVHASGALQCVPDPIATLRALVGLRAPYLALARFPIWKGVSTVGIQTSRLSDNGIGPLPPGIENITVRYPVTFIPLDVVMDVLCDYTLILKTASPSANYDVAGEAAPGATLIFRLV